MNQPKFPEFWVEWILEVFLDSGKCFGFLELFWILGSVFGFLELFWILGSVFGFLELFWILGSVLSSRATVVNPLIRRLNFLFLNIQWAMVAIVIYRQPHRSVEGMVFLGLIRLRRELSV